MLTNISTILARVGKATRSFVLNFIVLTAFLCCGLVVAFPALADEGGIQGNFNVELTISDISILDVAAFSARIDWETNADAASQIFYDTAAHDNITDYAYRTGEYPILVRDHTVTLTGLSSSTVYHFKIKSMIPDTDFVTISEDLTFTTLMQTVYTGQSDIPKFTIKTNLLGSEQTQYISSSGKILQMIEASTPDGTLTIRLPQGTTALDSGGKRLTTLNVELYENPPNPPEGARFIGIPYDFQPEGATYTDPPMEITWRYDPDTLGDIPEESLVLAYYDDNADVWIELDCRVDMVNHVITATVPHFTFFAILGWVPASPARAEFSFSSLTVSPGEVYPGDPVTVSVLAANTGGQTGSCNVTLKIDGVAEEVREVVVHAGLSKEVSFTVEKNQVAGYAVEVNGLTGTFTVRERPAPAEFSLDGLIISPETVFSGEPITIEVMVTNTGGETGDYTVVLKLNDSVLETSDVTLAAGAYQKAVFTVTRDMPGVYRVDIDGLSGSFTVEDKPRKTPPASFNWPLAGGIAGGIIALIVGIYFLTRKPMKETGQ